MGRDYGAKKRLYLARPEPDLLTTRRYVTRIIPPAPVEEPIPIIEEPEPCEPEPYPCPCPCPPALPEPEPQIEVIAVDVEPSAKSSKSSRSRSRSHSHTREKEVYIERDRYIPVPVPMPVRVEPNYDTYRYVEAPRRYIEPLPERKMIEDGGERTTHIHVRTEDLETSRVRRDTRERAFYERDYYEPRDYYRR